MFKKIIKQKVKNIHHFTLTIVRDLKYIPFTIQVIIICLGLFMIWNTFFDFNHIINHKQFPSIWKFVNNKQNKVWKQVLLALNGVAGFTSIICLF